MSKARLWIDRSRIKIIESIETFDGWLSGNSKKRSLDPKYGSYTRAKIMCCICGTNKAIKVFCVEPKD